MQILIIAYRSCCYAKVNNYSAPSCCATKGAHNMNSKAKVRIQSVKLITRFLRIMSDEDLIPVPEMNTIVAELKHLAEHGETMPAIMPKLITQEEAAAMLGVSYSNFKKLEREGAFSFKRRMVGSAVRYRNTDVIKFIMASENSCITEPVIN